MRRLETVSCSLNLGLIYSLSYSYSPENGISMTLFFVNESGEYNPPQLLPMTKANVKIGSASFALYPKSYKISKSAGRRVMSVDFVDETFMLDNYYVVLTGRGCGENVFELGAPVDKRTIQEKLDAALDRDAERIKEFTQFPDLEYNFNDLLTVIRRKFNVTVNASYDATETRAFVGSFRDVLSDWCGHFNLAYYFENSEIKIYDPTRLTVNIPTQQSIRDVLSYEVSEDIGSTYGKTVCNFFEQNGDGIPFNENFDDDAPSTSDVTKHITLYPAGYEFNLDQTVLDLNQVAAAAYGKEFWFLYNFYYNTLAECGWTKKTATFANNNVAEVNEKVGNDNFEAYSSYANFAGRWYISNEINSLYILKDTSWHSRANNLDDDIRVDNALNIVFLEPPDQTLSAVYQIPGTIINDKFKGINYIGNRMAFYDEKDNGRIEAFTLSSELKNLVVKLYDKAIVPGSDSLNLAGIAGIDASGNNVVYSLNQMPSELIAKFAEIKDGSKKDYFKPRYSSYPIRGIRKQDIVNRKDLENQPEETKPIFAQLPGVVSNTSIIKVKKEGVYTIYYDKYSKCVSRSSTGKYFKHKFEPNRISEDSTLTYSFRKDKKTYYIDRNFAEIDALLNNPYLQSLAQPRTFPTKTASFSVNYYYNVPLNFLSNGLVGIDMSYGENGLICTYTFSNSILDVPNKTNDFQKFENGIRNSWIRTYRPQQVISEQ